MRIFVPLRAASAQFAFREGAGRGAYILETRKTIPQRPRRRTRIPRRSTMSLRIGDVARVPSNITVSFDTVPVLELEAV